MDRVRWIGLPTDLRSFDLTIRADFLGKGVIGKVRIPMKGLEQVKEMSRISLGRASRARATTSKDCMATSYQGDLGMRVTTCGVKGMEVAENVDIIDLKAISKLWVIQELPTHAYHEHVHGVR